MRPCRWIAWLFLWFAALGCRLVTADDTQSPSESLRPGQPPRHLESPFRPEGRAPSVQLDLKESEVIKPGTALPPQQLDSPAALTLDDLQRIALQSNPTLVQAGMAVRAAQGTYLQAGLYPNPTIGYLGDEWATTGLPGSRAQG